MSNLFDNKTMVSWKSFLVIVIDDLKCKGFKFKHIDELNNITKAKKLDVAFDFYIKHNMCSLEWKLNSMINRNKALIINFTRDWSNPTKRKISCYCD